MALVAPDGRFLSVNHSLCRMLGYTREELEAITFQHITHVADLDADEENVRQLLAGERETYQMEKRYIHKSGREVWILLSVSLVKDKDGAPIHFISQIQDITERKNLLRQFLRAQRLESIGTLAGGIAHDLNNVLAPITMAIGLLRPMIRDERGHGILDVIESSALRGAEMVGQVLTFAKGAEGETVEVNVSHVARDVLHIMEETFPKNIRVRCECDETPWSVRGDATQIHQVLLNLCLNSRDAMPGGGDIRIHIANQDIDSHYAGMNLEAEEGPYVRIDIEDNGTGIPPEIADRLFDPFFTTKEPGKGTGLGLSTSLAIVRSHGGFMRLYSEPGKGTVLRAYFPAGSCKAAPPAPLAENPALHGSGELILLVDDEAAIRQICKQTLESAGYRVLLAAEGREAISIYQDCGRDIALVVTDMMMPVMDGTETIHALCDINPDVKILCTSGIRANEDNASACGGHFLTKPFTADALLHAISRALGHA